jgi:hypothetical protein
MDAVQQPMVAIQPGQQESEEDFIVRAHHALADQIPDPAERNQAVWNSWDRVKGNQLLEQANRYFAGDQYTATSPRPFFMEHEKVNYDGDGQEQITNYDLNELTRIVRENNHRIQDTDAYTALVDKHTLPPPYRDPDPPKNLGFVGPYRLGMMGRKNPRWGIFANEWQRNDRREQLQDRPNRSVEVLQLKANGRRYIDPIAALSEAPRLPLPTTAQYAAAAENDEAVTVERYDATPALNAVFPGGMNTFGKNTKPKRDRNQGKDMYGKTAVDPDMIREVLNALMSTDEWKAISEAAQAMGQDQPVVAGQNELGDPGMMDPMAGGMPEPPMDEPPMDEPMMDPGMDPGMVDPGMGADAMPPMEPGMEEEVVEEEVDQNVPPALAVAGRMALQQGAKAAGQTAGTMAAEKVMNRGKSQGQGGQQPRKQGILAKILAGPGEGNLAATPRQQFGAVPGYHRYDSTSEGNMNRDQYQAIQAENQSMRKELNQLKKHNDSLLTEQAQMYAATQHEVVQLRQNAIDAERKERLTNLAHRYSAVDLKQEMDHCLYKNNDNAPTNEEFDSRIALIEQYAAVTAPQSPMIPLGYDGMGAGDVQSDKFAARVADTALELVNQGIKSGNRLTYPEAVEKAKTQLSAE